MISHLFRNIMAACILVLMSHSTYAYYGGFYFNFEAYHANLSDYEHAKLYQHSSPTELVSVQDITDFLTFEPGKPIKNFLVARVIDKLETQGVTIKSAGLLYSETLSGGRNRCGSRKHSWKVDVDFLLSNETNISLLFEALNEPIVMSTYIDGEIGLDGKATFRPSTRIIGKCVRYDKIRVDIDLPNIPVELWVDTTVNLNPVIIKPEDSVSGNYAVFLNPTGEISAQITKFGDIDPSVDVDAYGGIGVIVGSIFGSPVGGFLLELGLAEVGGDYIADKISEKLENTLSGFVAEPYVKDITSTLGGRRMYDLPSNEVIPTGLISGVLQNYESAGIVCNNIGIRRDELLSEVLVYSSDITELPNLSKARDCANGVLSTLISASMLF